MKHEKNIFAGRRERNRKVVLSSVVLRQNDLFAGENWEVVYAAFENISFKNYSYTSVKSSLIEYIRVNYPEDFNDWTENSEFIMMLDLLSYLAETLSYRVDLNSRDNFIDLAERRESILRLAKMISYTPKRNYPSRGKVKIRSVRTSQIVLDSSGKNLQNRYILWNDPQNPDWYEQFLLVLNASLISTNPFGRPIKQIKKGAVISQLYQMNTVTGIGKDLVYQFNASVSGEAMNFEIVNVDLDEFGNLTERQPDYDAAKHLVYLNDGSGNASPNTGFFLYFKEGNLQYTDFKIDAPTENRVLNVDKDNVNEIDVWVSKINENEKIIENWTKVPSLENIVYNSVSDQIRNIYAVQTKDGDKVAIRFSDGRFGTVPRGIFRIWYRISNGLEYSIHPQEMSGRAVIMEYKNNKGIDQDTSYSLEVTFDLYDTIRNSAAFESNEDVKARASRVYYTQNRMVNGEDYNSYPLSYGPQIAKLKALNRVYSGQSPFFNNADPTKRYSSTIEFGDDGLIYKEDFKNYSYETLPTSLSDSQIVSMHIVPLLENVGLGLFFLDRNVPGNVTGNCYWNKVSGQKSVSTGYLSLTKTGPAIEVTPTTFEPINKIRKGSYLYFEKDGDYKWASVLGVSNNGIYESGQSVGPIVIDDDIQSGWVLKKVISSFRQTFTTSEMAAIVAQVNNKNTFGLRYDILLDRWIVVDELNVSNETSEWSATYAGNSSDNNLDASWFIRAQYSSSEYRFTVRLMRYIFESAEISRFFFNEDIPGIKQSLNRVARSSISILRLNEDYKTNMLLSKDVTFRIMDTMKFPDGFIDPRRVQVVPYDSDKDGTFDVPDAFDILTDSYYTLTNRQYIFHKKILDDLGFEEYVPTTDVLIKNTYGELTLYNWVENIENVNVGFAAQNRKFYIWNPDIGALEEYNSSQYTYHIGRSSLNYKHEHFSPENNRIDPAITNVVDMYVLTNDYHESVIEWKNTNRKTVFPVPEQSVVLQDTFSGLDQFKMISDQLIWNPAKFTLLFGQQAAPELQAIVKIVRIESSEYTDNQIKQGVVNAIEEYFALDNWDFGESIFSSELVAYIHKKMLTHVASVVIVPKQKDNLGNRNPSALYQIRTEYNTLPLNVSTVDDIVIVPSASQYAITST